MKNKLVSGNLSGFTAVGQNLFKLTFEMTSVQLVDMSNA